MYSSSLRPDPRLSPRFGAALRAVPKMVPMGHRSMMPMARYCPPPLGPSHGRFGGAPHT